VYFEKQLWAHIERTHSPPTTIQVHTIHTREGEGAVLVFLPGWDDITKVYDALQVSMSG